MAEAQSLARSYPKRKRAQISYYEGGSDREDAHESDASVVEYFKSKRVKIHKSRPLPKRKIFPFLQLPAELRNIIYGHCLTDPEGIYLVAKTERYRRIVERRFPHHGQSYYWRRSRYIPPLGQETEETTALKPLIPALLAVNQQIYEEALPILYDNDFMVEDTMVLHGFIANLSQKNRDLLTTITIKNWLHSRGLKSYNHCSLTILSTVPNLKTLYFDCHISYSTGPVWKARQIYRDAFHWLEAVGAAKGENDAAVDLIQMRSDNFERACWSRKADVPEPSVEKKMTQFQDELRKLLGHKVKRSRGSKNKAKSK